MTDDKSPQKRQFYRLRYPKDDRPYATLNGTTFRVCEISERGMRILFTHGQPVAIGMHVSGSIQFHDGTQAEIEGKTMRQDTDFELVLWLSKGLNLKRMTQEQIYLRAKYPRRFPRAAKKNIN